MTEVLEFTHAPRASTRRLPFLLGQSLAVMGLATDAVIIIGVAVLAGIAYHLAVYGQSGHELDFAKVGAVVALIRLLPYLQQSPSLSAQTANRAWRHEFYLWNVAFLGLLALGFLTKITGSYSRGAIALFYVTGFPILIVWQHLWSRFVGTALRSGWVATRRALLIGTPSKIVEFRRKYQAWGSGLIIAQTIMLPEEALEPGEAGETALKEALDQAMAVVRHSHPDDVFLLIPWSATQAINRCADMLITSPVSIHLGPEAIFDRFADTRMAKFGSGSTLSLVRPPLSRSEVWTKRAFDFMAGGVGLLLVSPVILIIAILIKLDSPGPVFFRQRRHGFNHKQFRIYKFRTMTVTEDGNTIEQAKANDPRVTRIGAYLRRWNLDELPQLINVITGDMSLVGPRPHALTHNREYERKIAFYARRHNIKPGITGWAQVNGLRGLTDTKQKMQGRVEHDLYYLDNWSILFDIYILFLTVFSPKSFKNAN